MIDGVVGCNWVGSAFILHSAFERRKKSTSELAVCRFGSQSSSCASTPQAHCDKKNAKKQGDEGFVGAHFHRVVEDDEKGDKSH